MQEIKSILRTNGDTLKKIEEPSKKISMPDIPKCKFCGKEYEFYWSQYTSPADLSGKYFPSCSCKEKREEQKRLGNRRLNDIRSLKDCGIGVRYENKTFSNYDKSVNIKAFDICREYARDIIKHLKAGTGLFISGDVGLVRLTWLLQ